MESSFGHAQNWMSSAEPWWKVTPDQMAGNMLEAGSKQLNDILHRDPLLRSIDQMWNANPFREIVPVDWAEIARALAPSGCCRWPARREPAIGGGAEYQTVAVRHR